MEKSIRPLGLYELAANIVKMMVARVGWFGLGLALAALLGHSLGPDRFGVFSLTLFIPTFLNALLNLGVAPANVYFINRGDVTVDGALKASLRIWSGISLLGLLVGGIFVLMYGELLFPDISIQVLLAGLVLFPLLLLNAFVLGILQAVGDFPWFNRLPLINTAATLVFAVVGVVVLDLSVVGALIAYAAGTLTSLLVSLAILRRHTTGSGRVSNLGNYAASCLKYGWKANLAALFGFLNLRSGILLVGFFLDTAAAGGYAAAVVIAERLWILSQSASTVVFPKLAALKEDTEARNRLTPLVSHWVFLTTFLLASIAALFSRPLLSVMFGEEFADAGVALMCLLPGVVMGSLTRVLANDFAARGRIELNVLRSGVLVVVNVVANCLLIPVLGVVGAAMAFSLGYFAMTAVSLYLYAEVSGNEWWTPLMPNHSDYVLAYRRARSFVVSCSRMAGWGR